MSLRTAISEIVKQIVELGSGSSHAESGIMRAEMNASFPQRWE
jgi:hypothetical protein